MSNYRWRICAILFFATTVNYVDRNVLSFTMIDDAFRREMLELPAGKTLTQAHLDAFKEKMGYVDAAFKLAYAMGFLIAGYFIDKLGTRKGFSIAIALWSLAATLNGFVGSIKGLGFTRFLLGLGESGNFPSAVKSVAEWFPRRERSFATGLFNAGANIGVIVTALAVPLITIHFGWRAAFIITGLLGLVVLLLWRITYYRPSQHPEVSQSELDYIHSDRGDNVAAPQLTWMKALAMRQTWTFAIGKFLADPIWYFYLTWLPDFFSSSESLDQKLDLKNIGLPFIIIYLVSDAGSIFFGWLSSRLIQSGGLSTKRENLPCSCARSVPCPSCLLPPQAALT